jgi:hypothetical protein
MVRQAGFVDVQQRVFLWLSNGWPKGCLIRELDRWRLINCL